MADTLPAFTHIQTYNGHPGACAAAMATIGILEDDNLIAEAFALRASVVAHPERDCPVIVSLGTLIQKNEAPDHTRREHER